MDLNTLFDKRASCRSFIEDKPVSEEDIRAIINAGIIAPNATNDQPWRFHVVRNMDINSAISNEILDFTEKNWNTRFESRKTEGDVKDPVFYDAPCVIYITYVPHANFQDLFSKIDIGLCLENIILKATELGLSTLVNGLSAVVKEFIATKLEFKEGEEYAVALLVGYAKKEYKKPERHPAYIKFY